MRKALGRQNTDGFGLMTTVVGGYTFLFAHILEHTLAAD